MQDISPSSILKPEDCQPLIESVTDYVVAVNKNYRIIMANDLFRKEFGMRPNARCYETWKNRSTRCERCPVQKAFADGRTHQQEETVTMPDGRPAQMLVKAIPVRNEHGEIVYVLETATDLTERGALKKEMERFAGKLRGRIAARIEELLASESHYRTMFERSRDAILLTDARGKVMEINQAGLKMLGFPDKGSVLGLPSALSLFESEADRRRFLKQISQEGFVTDFEARLQRHPGRVFHAQLTCNVILDVRGTLTGYMMIIRDITKWKQAQREIEKRNIRLGILLTVSMTVSSSLDLDEVLHSTINELLKILEPDSVRIYLLDDTRQILRLAAHKGHSAHFIEKAYMQQRKVGDGLLGQTVLTCQTRVVDNFLRSGDPYVDTIVAEGLQSTVYIPLVSKGKPVGVMCVSSHTPYEFSADHVKFLTAIGYQIGMAVDNANLYGSLQRAYQELKQAQEQVIRTEKLASLGKLAATIAHEINNPLAAVLTYTRLLSKLLNKGQFTAQRMEDIARYLGTMENETARCGEIVKNLLAFSRQSRVKMETHAVSTILDRTLSLISHDLEMRRITLRKHIEPDLPEIRCDFRQIQQALLNLMSNAAEAMSEGGTLSVSARRAREPGKVEVSITDTGCGIPDKDLKNIFEPFFTTKEEGKGVGLGLSVVYGIVTRHNGTIEVESKVGRGSTFTVTLPQAQDKH